MTAFIYREDTPIEEYFVQDVRVFVKRDDLFGIPPAPPLGKLRGLRVVLSTLFKRGVRLVGSWDTRVSRLGQGLAAGCTEFPGMRAIVSYPTKQGVAIPSSIVLAEKLGAEILPLRGNHVAISYAQARKHVVERGGEMLPFGMECLDAVREIAKVASKVPRELAKGTVMLSCGSGVTLAGLLAGLPSKPRKLIGLSSGRSIPKIKACVERYTSAIPSWVHLQPAVLKYDEIATVACPFPAHPNYDLKAWQYLSERISELPQPILFWNIGA